MGEDHLRPPGHWRGHRTPVSSGKFVTRWGWGTRFLSTRHHPGVQGAGGDPPGPGGGSSCPFCPSKQQGRGLGGAQPSSWGAQRLSTFEEGPTGPGDGGAEAAHGLTPSPHGILGTTDPSGAHQLPSGRASAPTLPLHAAPPAQSVHGGPEGREQRGSRAGGAEPGWAGGHGRRGLLAPTQLPSLCLSLTRAQHTSTAHTSTFGALLGPARAHCCTPLRLPETQPCPWRPQPGSGLQAPRGPTPSLTLGPVGAALCTPPGASSAGTRRSAQCLDVPPPRRMVRPTRGREAPGTGRRVPSPT